MPRTMSPSENTTPAQRQVLSIETIESLPSSSNLSFLEDAGSVTRDTTISCDNHWAGQCCANKIPCLRHQQQTFEIKFKVTTQGGPLIDPLNFHHLWKNIAKKSREAPAMCRPILNGFKLTEEKMLSENLKDEKCSICLEEYKTSDLVCKTLCGHCFHKKCLAKYLKKEAEDSLIYRCPMCRHHLTFKHRVNQYFHIRSNYKVRENQVICDQSVYDFTGRLYNYRRNRRRQRRRSRTRDSQTISL